MFFLFVHWKTIMALLAVACKKDENLKDSHQPWEALLQQHSEEIESKKGRLPGAELTPVLSSVIFRPLEETLSQTLSLCLPCRLAACSKP